MSRRPWLLLVIGAVLLVSAATPVAAGTINVLTSLSPGDPYRLAFVTSTTRDATSKNIDDYNTFVTDAANAVPEFDALGTTWKAIVSTSSVKALDNTATVPLGSGGSLGVPISLLNDTKLVAGKGDLRDGYRRTKFDYVVGNYVVPVGASVWSRARVCDLDGVLLA